MHRNNTISLYSYLYHKLAKTPCFFINFYIFSCTKSQNRRAEQVLPQGAWAPVGGGGNGKRGRRMNLLPVKTVPGISGQGMKESSGGGEFKYNIFDTLLEPL
jgi:hypothetical protein